MEETIVQSLIRYTPNTKTALEQLHSELLTDSFESLWNIKPQRFIHLHWCFTMFRNLKNTLKIISVLSLVLLTTFFLKPDVALADDFGKICDNHKLDIDKTHVYLTGTCDKTNGQKAYSKLDLNKYIANHNGKLIWSPGEGGFLKTCPNNYIHLTGFDGEFLVAGDCEVLPNNPRSIQSVIALKRYISNQNGVLTPSL